MSFARLELLWIAAVLPIALGLLVLRFVRRRRRVAIALGEPHLVERLGGQLLTRVPLLRFLLLLLAAIALGIAAAGPRWGLRNVENQTRSRSFVLALDISKSMLARDVTPSRLERERLIVRRILRELAGDRVGLVIFAGRAYVVSPLTSDQSALQLYIDALDPEMVSQGGSAVGGAIDQAGDLARGPTGRARGATVVLISDGESTEEEQDAVARATQRARKLGVVVHTVGLGTADGDRIPEINPSTGRITGYKFDAQGNLVISRMNEPVLRSIADETGGSYFGANQTGALIATLKGLQRTAGALPNRQDRKDQSVWFIAGAILLLALDHVVGRRRAKAASDVREARRTSPVTKRKRKSVAA